MTVVIVARDAEGIDHWGEGEGGEEEGKILDGLYLKRYFLQFLGWATALRPGRPGTKTLAASAAAVVGRSTMSSRVVPRPPRRRGGGGEPGAKALAAAADAAATSAAVGGRSTGHCRSTLPSSPPPPLPPTASPPADPPTPRVAASAVTLGRPPLATRRVPRGVAAPRRGSPAPVASRVSTNKRGSRARGGGGAGGRRRRRARSALAPAPAPETAVPAAQLARHVPRRARAALARHGQPSARAITRTMAVMEAPPAQHGQSPSSFLEPLTSPGLGKGRRGNRVPGGSSRRARGGGGRAGGGRVLHPQGKPCSGCGGGRPCTAARGACGRSGAAVSTPTATPTGYFKGRSRTGSRPLRERRCTPKRSRPERQRTPSPGSAFPCPTRRPAIVWSAAAPVLLVRARSDEAGAA